MILCVCVTKYVSTSFSNNLTLTWDLLVKLLPVIFFPEILGPGMRMLYINFLEKHSPKQFSGVLGKHWQSQNHLSAYVLKI